ncbi:MAG: RagB/SusD family nutrient uptake outer membrane protein, partial [Tannerellaceae bacterium]|nr:RagB/SusD family nutrient uptake outer membrane protein [Tannerellaceae bacterium]
MKGLNSIYKQIRMISVLVGITILSSCDLDVIPPDTIAPENYWTSENDATLFLNSIYSSSRSTAYNYMYADVFSDDVYNRHSHEAAGFLFVQNGLNPGSNYYTNTHNWSFVNIRMTNIFLANVDQVPMNEDTKERMKLEARFWRAWDYLFKTNQWGKVPIIYDEILEYDVPMMQRNSQEEVYDYIISEAKACYNGLPASYSGSDYGRVTRWAARALQAKAELYSGKYAEAAATAKDIIDNGGFSLFQPNQLLDPKEYTEMDQFIDWAQLGIDKDTFMKGIYNYGGIWTEPNGNPEYILTRQYVDASGYTDWTRYIFIRPAQCNTSDGWSSITPTQNLVDAYWTADGKEFTPPPQSTRVQNFTAMDEEWLASGQTIERWSNERIENNTLKDYSYIQEFRNRDARLYASILFPFKSWNISDVGEFTYRFKWRDGGEQNNESKTGFNWRKQSALQATTSDVYGAGYEYPVIRLAEIILMYAEATTLATGYNSNVAAELNKLRQRVGMPDVPAAFSSKEDAIEFIRKERRIELAGEGRRSEDVSRYEEEYWKKHMDNVAIEAPNGANVLTMQWNSRMRLKPIPQNAVDLNPSLQKDQNPGYN